MKRLLLFVVVAVLVAVPGQEIAPRSLAQTSISRLVPWVVVAQGLAANSGRSGRIVPSAFCCGGFHYGRNKIDIYPAPRSWAGPDSPTGTSTPSPAPTVGAHPTSAQLLKASSQALGGIKSVHTQGQQMFQGRIDDYTSDCSATQARFRASEPKQPGVPEKLQLDVIILGSLSTSKNQVWARAKQGKSSWTQWQQVTGDNLDVLSLALLYIFPTSCPQLPKNPLRSLVSRSSYHWAVPTSTTVSGQAVWHLHGQAHPSEGSITVDQYLSKSPLYPLRYAYSLAGSSPQDSVRFDVRYSRFNTPLEISPPIPNPVPTPSSTPPPAPTPASTAAILPPTALPTPASTTVGTFTTIDDPNGTYGTSPNFVSTCCGIAGDYSDTPMGSHGFLLRNGTYTTIDDPSAGHDGGTSVSGLNSRGEIVGTYVRSDADSHGFVLRGGTYTTLDDPNAGFDGTSPESVNGSGDIVGAYVGGDQHDHGFLFHNGSFTDVDEPNAVVPGGPGGGTELTGINDNGDKERSTMNHRGHGEGTIAKRADGRWTAALSLPGGKRKWAYGSTRKEVQNKLAGALKL